eukprot:107001_1
MWVSIACSDLFLESTRRNDPHLIFSQRLCVISTYTNRDFTMPCNPCTTKGANSTHQCRCNICGFRNNLIQETIQNHPIGPDGEFSFDDALFRHDIYGSTTMALSSMES